MALDEVTLFEFDLKDAQFGPKDMNIPDRVKGKVDTGSSSDKPGVEVKTESQDSSSGGMGKGRMVLMGLVAVVVATMVAKRLRGGSEDEEQSTPIEFEEDEEKAPEIGA